MSTDNTFVVNSAHATLAFATIVRTLFAEYPYITFSWRFGEDRSIDQNSLFHVWLTEYAAHLLKKDKKQVTKGEVEGMKRHVKKTYYHQTGYAFLVHEIVNPKTPEQKRREFTSSSDWKVPEMFEFMTWLQMMAANDGLVLESKGQYQKLQKENA